MGPDALDLPSKHSSLLGTRLTTSMLDAMIDPSQLKLSPPRPIEYPADASKRPDLLNLALAEYHLVTLRVRLTTDFPPEPSELLHGEVLLAALKFCEQGCSLARAAVVSGAYLHEMIVVRPMLEVAARLLYAVRCPDGWRRYFRYWAQQDLAWAQEASRLFPRESFAKWEKDAEAYQGSIPVESMPYKLPSLFDAIIRAEQAAGYPIAEDKDAVAAILFKLAHSVTHGNPEHLLANFKADSPNGQFNTGKCILFGQVVYLLTRAVYIYRGWAGANESARRYVRSYYRP